MVVEAMRCPNQNPGWLGYIGDDKLLSYIPGLFHKPLQGSLSLNVAHLHFFPFAFISFHQTETSHKGCSPLLANPGMPGVAD